MLVVHSIDERFALFLRIFWIDIFGNLIQYGLVKGAGNNLTIEMLHIKVQFVAELFAVGDFSGYRVVNCYGIAGLIVDTLIPQFCVEIMGGIVIHQIALDDCFTVSILENRLAKNLGCLESRGSGQGNFHCIEILNHTAVFTLIISLISIEKFGIAHFLI